MNANSTSDPLDEAGRPRPSGGLQLDAHQLRPGEHLRMIHDHFRSELARLVRMADAVADDELAIADLTDAMEKLSMRRNYEAFGTFCGMACQMVDLHHRIENANIFPQVAQLSLYAPLVEKLRREHGVIHAQLLATDAALATFVLDNSSTEPLRSAIRALRDALFSHLDYEDEQLPEPLGLIDLPV